MTIQSKKSLKAILASLIIGLVLFQLSGCVYLRLLELKNQFKDFDDYIEIRTDGAFSLYFKQPVLFKDDIHDLSRLAPTRKLVTANGEEWVYHFVKQNDLAAAGKPSTVSLIFRFKFNQQGKLEQWYFPDEFLAIVPPVFLEASLRSLGDATIFKLSRQLKAEVTRIKTPTRPPDQHSVKQVLGEPQQIVEKGNLERYLYRFQLLTDWVEDGYEARRIALVKLDFVERNKLLVKASPRFAGLKISISYSKLLGDEYFAMSSNQ